MAEPVESPGQMIQVPVTLRFWDKEPTQGTAVILERDFIQRMKRALVQLLTYWGLALVSLFIPVAHFILVPGFLIAGVIAAQRKVKEEQTLLSVSGPCPRCESDQKFSPNSRFEPGMKLQCPGCKNDLVLSTAV